MLWAACWVNFGRVNFGSAFFADSLTPHPILHGLIPLLAYALLSWALVALAVLDAEHFWLPDWITLPGIALGLAFSLLQLWSEPSSAQPIPWRHEIAVRLVEILLAAGVVLIIRLAYWLVRRKEGMGLGDAKLMAMLGAWFGWIGAMESFALAVLGATLAALIWLAVLITRKRANEWAQMPLPLGTFLCLAALSEIFYPQWIWKLLGGPVFF